MLPNTNIRKVIGLYLGGGGGGSDYIIAVGVWVERGRPVKRWLVVSGFSLQGRQLGVDKYGMK